MGLGRSSFAYPDAPGDLMKKGYMDPALFMEKNSLLACRLTECRRKKNLLAGKMRHTKEIVQTRQMIGLLEEQDGILREFREELFDLTVKEIRISQEHEITFCLHNGLMLAEKERGGADAVAHADRI